MQCDQVHNMHQRRKAEEVQYVLCWEPMTEQSDEVQMTYGAVHPMHRQMVHEPFMQRRQERQRHQWHWGLSNSNG